METETNGRLKILVVEDEAILAMNLQDSLLDLGYEVPGTAQSTDEAVRLAGQHHPDLVLMDIKLKDGGDGVEAARQIQQQYQIPVVFMTAYGDEQTRQRADGLRPCGYLTKPFRLGQLNHLLAVVFK